MQNNYMDSIVSMDGAMNRYNFMIATNEYINNALILCCGYESDEIGILDRVSMVYTKLFVIINTLLQHDVFDVPALPTIHARNIDWKYHNYISLALAQNIITVYEMFNGLDPRTLCQRYYDEAIYYWTRNACHSHLDIRGQRRYVPIPSFDNNRQLVLSYEHNSLDNDSDDTDIIDNDE